MSQDFRSWFISLYVRKWEEAVRSAESGYSLNLAVSEAFCAPFLSNTHVNLKNNLETWMPFRDDMPSQSSRRVGLPGVPAVS